MIRMYKHNSIMSKRQDDCDKIKETLEAEGYQCSLDAAHDLWEGYSEDIGQRWAELPENLNETLIKIINHE